MSRTVPPTPSWVIDFGKRVLITMHESATSQNADYRSILTMIPAEHRQQVLQDIETYVQGTAKNQVRIHCFRPRTVEVTDVDTYTVGEMINLTTGPLTHRTVLGLSSRHDERYENTVFGFCRVESIDRDAGTVTVLPFMGFRILRPSVKERMLARREEAQEEHEVEKTPRRNRRGGRR